MPINPDAGGFAAVRLENLRAGLVAFGRCPDVAAALDLAEAAGLYALLVSGKG